VYNYRSYSLINRPKSLRDFKLIHVKMTQSTLDSFVICNPCPVIPEKPKYVRRKCPHGRQRCDCVKCGGASICEHGTRRRICKKCGGASICEHGTRRNICKKCGGASICEHGRERRICKKCGGESICEHKRERRRCKDCGGGSICEHGRERTRCKKCGGGSICEHERERCKCPICDPCGYAISLRRTRRYHATKTKNPTGALEDLCMTNGEWVKYLHKTFEDNYGRKKTDDDKVHIDEIIPCDGWNLPADNKYCWHYLNSQWLTDNENQGKGSNYTEEDKRAMIKRIDEWFILNQRQPCSTSSP